MKQTIEELIYEETDRRLKIMGAKDYEFPRRIGSADYIAMGVMILVCLALIILCMTGGIN